MSLFGLAIRFGIMVQYIPTISAEWQGVAAVWAFGDFCELALKPTAAATGLFQDKERKAMKKIETRTDVLEWAQSVVSANGEKFTALTKGDQYTIAKYIVDTLDGETQPPKDEPKAEYPTTATDEPIKGNPEAATPTAPTATPTETPTAPTAPTATTSPKPNYALAPQAQKAIMTRSYAYHRAGFDAQQVFDKFLEWCKEHPKSNEVMDFSTGRKSSDAAFAYWLADLITVDVPNQ